MEVILTFESYSCFMSICNKKITGNILDLKHKNHWLEKQLEATILC